MRALPLLIVLTAACGAVDHAFDSPDNDVYAARLLAFETDDDGVSRGFDLDGSAAGDGDGCGISDFTGPDGEAGIDNSFAGLLPVLDLFGGDALPELVQAAVTSGELLLLFEVAPIDDECTEITVLRASGQPQIGGDGLILPGQTFDVDAAAPWGRVDCAQVEGDTLVGGGLGLRIPLTVFDESIDLGVGEATTSLTPHPSLPDAYLGVVSGGVSVQEIQDNVATFDGIPQALHDAVNTTLGTRADLSPDDAGVCTEISVVLGFEAVRAFIYEDTERPDAL